MSHGRKSRFSVSTKLALGIIVVVAIAALLYYSPSDSKIKLPYIGIPNINFDKINPSLIGGNIKDDPVEPTVERVEFSVVSEKDILIGRTIEVERVSVAVEGTHTQDTSIGEMFFDNMGTDFKITFSGFKGRISKNSTGYLTLKGEAESSTVNKVTVRSKNPTFPVNAEVDAEAYSIDDILINRLDLSGISGNVKSLGEESGNFKVSDSDININNFQGSISNDGQKSTLSGSASKVKGKSFEFT